MTNPFAFSPSPTGREPGLGVRCLHAFDKTTGLARPAKVSDALVRPDERDGSPAARAWLAGLHVDCQEIPRFEVNGIAHLGADLLRCVTERVLHRVVKPLGLVGGE